MTPTEPTVTPGPIGIQDTANLIQKQLPLSSSSMGTFNGVSGMGSSDYYHKRNNGRINSSQRLGFQSELSPVSTSAEPSAVRRLREGETEYDSRGLRFLPTEELFSQGVPRYGFTLR